MTVSEMRKNEAIISIARTLNNISNRLTSSHEECLSKRERIALEVYLHNADGYDGEIPMEHAFDVADDFLKVSKAESKDDV